MQIDRIASVYAARPLLGSGLLRPKPGIPILMYHSVSDDPEAGVSAYYRVSTSPARFRAQMQYLHDRRFEVIDLPEALRRIEIGLQKSERSVVLTFDDGFEDFRTHAWPVLAGFGFTATMFLPTAFIGSARQSFNARGCLTWPEVRDLHGEGASFGAHTVNHPVLYRMTWEDIRRELHDSRARIEDELQAPVSSFAYPYAFPQEDDAFVSRFRDEVADEGYDEAVTTIIGRAGPDADPWTLKRLPVNECDDAALFGSKLAGAYDWMGGVQRLVRQAKQSGTRVFPSSS